MRAEAARCSWEMRAVICLNVDLDVYLYFWAHFDTPATFLNRFVVLAWSCQRQPSPYLLLFVTNYYTTCSVFLLRFWLRESFKETISKVNWNQIRKEMFTNICMRFQGRIRGQNSTSWVHRCFFQGKWNAFPLPRAVFGPSGVCVAPAIVDNVTNT